MKMKRLLISLLTSLVILAAPSTAMAQEESRAAKASFTISTTYPNQVVELGESITIKMDINAFGEDETVTLEMDEMPEGWKATFRGGGRIINSVFVEAGSTESIDLRLDPPENPELGEFTFVVLAQGEQRNAELPITLVVQEKIPASLTLTCDLPTIKGSPTTTFRYSAKLENTGDQELMVNLVADTPAGLLTKFKVSGQEVTSFPLGANQTKTIDIELEPIIEISAGKYTFTIFATGGDLQASLDLVAEVTGQQNISISGLDGRLSGRANAGKETAMQIVVQNTGTSAAQGIEINASAPSGWEVTFDPEVISEIPAGEVVEVTAYLKPGKKTVAGDYMVTLRAKPKEGTTESAEFRITVVTSTLWGIVGIGMIAVAVGVVAIAVTRFGRR